MADSSTSSSLEPSVKEQYLHVYNTVLDRLPWLKASLNDFIEDGSILEFAILVYLSSTPHFSDLKYISLVQIDKSAQSGRGTDSSHMKISSINYMPLNPVSPDTPAIPIDASKAFRGLRHPRTAALLCPKEHLAEYQQDPETWLVFLGYYWQRLTQFLQNDQED